MFSKPRGRTKFQFHWKEEYPWAESVHNDFYSAKCKICNSIFHVDSMGKTALKSHSQSKKHISRCQQVDTSNNLGVFLLKKNNNPSSSAESSPIDKQTAVDLTTNEPLATSSNASSFPEPPTKKKKTMDTFLKREAVTKAELVWCLHSVSTHTSLRAAGEAVTAFPVMFPDSAIADKMQLQKSKIAYTIVHGLGPYFKNKLNKTLQSCKQIVVGFDESLNKVAQRQQMDVNIRFWDDAKQEVSTRYYDSVFLEHCTAEDLLAALKKAVPDTKLKNIVQLSMDGPNVNAKLFRILKEDLQNRPETDIPEMLDIGSCGIHTVHCAFKNAIKSTGWKLIPFLRGIYNLFKDAPSRKGDFRRITGQNLFPLKFCAVRWLENVPVAERALKMLPHLEKYCETIIHTNKIPKCESFAVVRDGLKSNLLRAQLTFFLTLFEKITPFLRDFQSDDPLVPFLYTELFKLTKNCLVQVVKHEVLQSTPLHKIDLEKPSNLIEAKDIDLGFGTRSAIRQCKDTNKRDMLNFREECKKCTVMFSKKMIERSPLKFQLAKALSCLDPSKNVESEKDATSRLLQSALDHMVEKRHFSGMEADRIVMQFNELTQNPFFKARVETFTPYHDRVDKFWMNAMEPKKKEYAELSKFIQTVCIMSHGNANLERGFSINKECVVENQKEISLIAQRHIIESINSFGGVFHVPVDKEMISYARNSRSRYEEYLKSEKLKDEETKRAYEEKKRNAAKVLELQKEKQTLEAEAMKKLTAIDEQLLCLKNKM